LNIQALGRHVLDSQTLTAFGAARIDHGAAATGFHTYEETVGTGAAGFGRLVCAFHGVLKNIIANAWSACLTSPAEQIGQPSIIAEN
jgi:hypothetical protein